MSLSIWAIILGLWLPLLVRILRDPLAAFDLKIGKH
jgi:hypothetical protein